MARCTDCDNLLTDLDRKAMAAVNEEYAYWGVPVPYGDDEDADAHCDDCITSRAERNQERRDEDYYGGDTPTLAETMALARRFK